MIELQNISKFYYTDTSVTLALNKINLTFPETGFVCITGESGSGKSTLLNIISGLDTFDDGEMFFDGNPTFQFDKTDWENYRREKIGFVFQNYGLIGHYSTLDNCMAALLIQGLDEETSKKKALDYLEKVGLKEQIKLRASDLSSGQKQRLSIARALAKNTPVIVADEPTGNLDSETSAQIIDLLKELSEDKLIIMVTHDYERVEHVATKKIRLHDGELVSAVDVNQGALNKSVSFENAGDSEISATNEDENKIANDSETNLTSELENESLKESNLDKKEKIKDFFNIKLKQNIKAFRFFGMDLRGQRTRNAVFMMFFIFTSLVSFIFLGELFLNKDDRSTREYDNSAFLNETDKRILVKRADGARLKSEDAATLKKLNYVTDVDTNDLCNDINFYINEGSDYRVLHGDKTEDGQKVSRVEFIETKKYMRTASAISSDELKDGRLPQSKDEVVLYSNKEYELGDKVHIYFKNEHLWDNGEYYDKDFTVVGLLKHKTSQVYFSTELSNMLTASMSAPQINMSFLYSEQFKKFYGRDSFVLVVADDLGIDEVRVSENYKVDIAPSEAFGQVSSVESAFVGNVSIDYKTVVEGADETAEGEVDTTSLSSAEDVEMEKVQLSAKNYDSGDEDKSNFSKLSPIFLEVSQELFDACYANVSGSYQGDVYITDYSKTDKVLKELTKAGYVGISTYRVSTTNYVPEKVTYRLITISISIAVLIILFVLQILIIRSLMKIKISEFYIFKFMGMRQIEIDDIVKFTMGFYALVSGILVLFVMSILSLFKINFISEIIQYYTLINIIIYFVYILIMAYVSSKVFTAVVKKKNS